MSGPEPSAVRELVPHAGPIVLVGRLREVDGTRATLEDAQGRVPCRLPGSAAVRDGDLVRVRGRTDRRQFLAASCEVLGRPDPGAVDPDAWEDPEGRARLAAILARDQLLSCLRRGFRQRGFCEVSTPVLLRAPGQEPHLQPFETRFEGRRLFLATSPEYAMKRLLVGGLPRLFQIGPSFRAGAEEWSDLHEPEFQLLEWYRAHETLAALGADLHWLLRDSALALTGGTVLERNGLRSDLGGEPEWLPVVDAFADLAGVDLEPYLDGDDRAFLAALGVARDPGRPAPDQADQEFFRLLVERVERRLGVGRPVLLCRYPVRHAALAEPAADDPRVAERFELYVLGVELANAYQELRDPVEQERRFREEDALRVRLGGAPLPPCEEFLRSLRQGLPPAAGIALGVDRLLALHQGARRLREVMAQPFRPSDPAPRDASL